MALFSHLANSIALNDQRGLKNPGFLPSFPPVTCWWLCPKTGFGRCALASVEERSASEMVLRAKAEGPGSWWVSHPPGKLKQDTLGISTWLWGWCYFTDPGFLSYRARIHRLLANSREPSSQEEAKNISELQLVHLVRRTANQDGEGQGTLVTVDPGNPK